MIRKKTIKINVGIVLLLAVAGMQFKNVAAQSIGRLFSTPAERAELERQRLRMVRPELVPQISEPESIIELPIILEPEMPDVIYRLGGTMQRSDGMYTVWINGVPIEQENLPDNMELLQPFEQGRLRISHLENGANYEIKPGQVLNLTTGELFESYDFEEPIPATADAANSVTESDPGSDTLATESADSN